MEKISIEKIRCSHPLSFYACWMVVLWWMTLSIVTWGYCPLLDLIGLMGFGAIFLMIAGTFGTVSGKKVFLCNVYDGVAKYYKKVLGYEKAMKEAGLEPLVFRTSGDVSINSLHFTEFVKNRHIDALIGVRDSIAISFMNIAIKQGFRVPEDISVIGLQNIKYAVLSRPNLTCIDTPGYDIGAVSMRLLTKIMNNDEVTETKVFLPYSVVERESA